MDPRIIVNLFHILVVAPLFLFIGYYKSDTSETVFNFVVFLSLFVIAYHAWRYYQTGWFINYVHIFIGIVLLILSFFGKKLPNFIFYIFYVMASLVIGIHGFIFFDRCCSTQINNLLQIPTSSIVTPGPIPKLPTGVNPPIVKPSIVKPPTIVRPPPVIRAPTIPLPA